MSAGVEVTVCVDTADGDDALEAPACLPIIPRRGDRLQVLMPSGIEYLRVKLVSLPTHMGPSARIEVWVQLPDCYEREVLDEAFKSLREGWGEGQ